MIKKALLFAALVSSLWGDVYNEFLLETQLSLLPKIALLEKTVASSKETLDILIVYSQEDEDTAKYAASFLERKFQNKLGRYAIRVSLSTFDKCCHTPKPSLIYCLNGRDAQLMKVYSYARNNNIISAVYDSENLKEGFLFSVVLERSPVILMNKKTLKERQFEFPQTLYTIVRPI